MKAKNSQSEIVKSAGGNLTQSVQCEREALDTVMEAIFRKDCRTTVSLWVSVAAGLKQYKLQNMYDVKFILNESYIRGVNAINDGKSITSHIAWLRKVSYHVIQELSRQRQHRQNDIDIDELQGGTIEEEGENPRSAKHKRMCQALSQLTPLEQRILTLKVVRGLKWQKIRTILADEGYGLLMESALRQRKTRALKKLRSRYQSMPCH